MKVVEIKKESGTAMIEAVYVVVTAVLMIFFVINIAVIYYNRIVLAAVADEAANGVAEIYGSLDKEPFYNYTATNYFQGRNVYRYWFGGKGKHRNTTASKGKWYASYLLHEKEFSVQHSMDFSDVTVKCEKNELGLDVVTVEIEREYPVFIINPVSFWKLDPQYTVKASGSAVCYDIIHQMNNYAFVKELQNKVDGMTALTSGIDNVLEIIKKIFDLLTPAPSAQPAADPGGGGGGW